MNVVKSTSDDDDTMDIPTSIQQVPAREAIRTVSSVGTTDTAAAAISGSLVDSLVSEHDESDTEEQALHDHDHDDDDGVDNEDDESEYSYEDEDDTHYGGFIMPVESSTTTDEPQQPAGAAMIVEQDEEDDEEPAAATKKWVEPSKQAINMSLRAEKETTGGKRRLAADLYKIMMADTKDAGFSLEPKNEDCMDKWTIKLFQFDEDSTLSQDLLALGLDHVELEMSFPDQYPFEPPFVRVVSPRFKRQTGFVMNGALCMELLTKDGWNPVNDIESVIVSIRSLLVVGEGRLEAAVAMSDEKRQAAIDENKKAMQEKQKDGGAAPPSKKLKSGGEKTFSKQKVGQYSVAEAEAAYSHLSDYHKKKGWDTNGWWAKKG